MGTSCFTGPSIDSSRSVASLVLGKWTTIRSPSSGVIFGSMISVDPIGKRGSMEGLLVKANALVDEYSVVIQLSQLTESNVLISLLASRQSDQEIMAIDWVFAAVVVIGGTDALPVRSISIVTPKKSANALRVEALGSPVFPDKILCKVGCGMLVRRASSASVIFLSSISRRSVFVRSSIDPNVIARFVISTTLYLKNNYIRNYTSYF